MAMTLITTNTSSDAATSDFTTGIDNTYKLYIFKYYDVNPATDSADFTFQANVADESGFNETVTSTAWRAYHYEDDSVTALGYRTADDQAQGTAFIKLAPVVGNGADESCAGELHLFNPSNTTYVKHFYATTQEYFASDASREFFAAGYFNVTGAIDEIQFKMSSGNMDAVISMYGVG
jgi:hypothetical protein